MPGRSTDGSCFPTPVAIAVFGNHDDCMRKSDYTDLELRQIVAQRRRELTARDVELAKQQRQIAQERAHVASELNDLDEADRLLE
ncbi:hypothetical protein SEA_PHRAPPUCCINO_10 [Mycobacterium phage Phrappuccino]|uniref:Uncharacterized protein n=1 Tax=Mycobacterium phage Phrappuccino TaxID=2591223 RepID=A0A514DDL0_9CAUD|nr:hypothetical protein KHQ87_gp010 [Mycobacterium phage Phrappuccino]QDH91688.1 hypothetical protein SEA_PHRAPPUCCINO_10 [Mycobacterium phage Phrappuccino]QIQ63132.1 hypothetical protein SEA_SETTECANDELA_10 [Mycobacterium phage Settecandela]